MHGPPDAQGSTNGTDCEASICSLRHHLPAIDELDIAPHHACEMAGQDPRQNVWVVQLIARIGGAWAVALHKCKGWQTWFASLALLESSVLHCSCNSSHAMLTGGFYCA